MGVDMRPQGNIDRSETDAFTVFHNLRTLRNRRNRHLVISRDVILCGQSTCFSVVPQILNRLAGSNRLNSNSNIVEIFNN